eukprot:gene12552-2291_t
MEALITIAGFGVSRACPVEVSDGCAASFECAGFQSCSVSGDGNVEIAIFNCPERKAMLAMLCRQVKADRTISRESRTINIPLQSGHRIWSEEQSDAPSLQETHSPLALAQVGHPTAISPAPSTGLAPAPASGIASLTAVHAATHMSPLEKELTDTVGNYRKAMKSLCCQNASLNHKVAELESTAASASPFTASSPAATGVASQLTKTSLVPPSYDDMSPSPTPALSGSTQPAAPCVADAPSPPSRPVFQTTAPGWSPVAV